MKNIALLTLLFSFLSLNAQQNSFCGTHISQSEMQAFYQRNTDHLNTNKDFNQVVLPVSYHIIGRNDGSGYYELNEVFRSHCELQEAFNPANISFYIHEILYIDNTTYFNGDQDNNRGMFDEFNNPNTINVYIANSLDGVCGYSFLASSFWQPNRGGVMVQKGCMQTNNNTYRHEMGHYLNLPHTFNGWENQPPPNNNANAPSTIGSGWSAADVERADGSNCTSAGDGFCDTPPDYIANRWACSFDRTFLDPVGIEFTVDEKNIMSYSNDPCSEYFSSDQLAEVNNAASEYRDYLFDLPVPTFKELNVISESFPFDGTENINSGSIVISWGSQENADYYQVQVTSNNFINPIFDVVTTDTFYVLNNVTINTTYQYRIKPINFTNTCTDYSIPKSFTTSARRASITTTDLVCEESTNGEATVNIQSSFGSATYTWYSDLAATQQIPFEFTNTISGLSSGDYSVIAVINNTDTLFMTFTVNASNPLDINIIQNGATLEATVSGGQPPYSTTWNTGSPDLVLTNPVEGENFLVVLDQNGCQQISYITFSKDITAIRDVSQNISSFNIAPNPLQNNTMKLFFSSDENGEAAVSITTINGKTLFTKNIDVRTGENKILLNNMNLAEGLYFVHLNMNGIVSSKKLMVLQ